MNKLKLKGKSTKNHLDAALELSVNEAINLGISESDLVARLLDRLHLKARSKVVPLYIEPQRKRYNPEAGP